MTPTPRARVEVDPNFEKTVRALRDGAAAEAQAIRAAGGFFSWRRPATAPDLHDYAAIAKAFNRDQANRQFAEATSDPKDPGVTGDLVAAATMADELAVAGRAYAMRHTMRRPRAAAHMLARLAGHGDELGVLGNNVLEYVREVIKRGRQTDG